MVKEAKRKLQLNVPPIEVSVPSTLPKIELMIRSIYLLLAGCLATGCIQQANTTHSNQESAMPTPVNTSTQTDSISHNLQSSKVNINREITTFPFINDTLETVLSSKSIKTFYQR